MIAAQLATLSRASGARSSDAQRVLRVLVVDDNVDAAELLAPEWLPLETAIAHYAACDAPQLTSGELMEIGEDAGERI